jgi:hypothetical protein
MARYPQRCQPLDRRLALELGRTAGKQKIKTSRLNHQAHQEHQRTKKTVKHEAHKEHEGHEEGRLAVLPWLSSIAVSLDFMAVAVSTGRREIG